MTKRDARTGRKLQGATQVRLSLDQLGYLDGLADARGTSISEEIRRCVDEAMIATVEARRRRDREVRRLQEAEDWEGLEALYQDVQEQE